MSTQATVPLFKRKYRVDVKIPQVPLSGSEDESTIITVADSDDPTSLRVKFDIYQVAFQVFWVADISIYNLDQVTTDKLMGPTAQSIEVTVQAGYQSGPGFGTIWSGPVFQTLFERENTVDYKLTLHCILGLMDISKNFVNQTFARGITQADLAQKVADSSFSKIPVAAVSDKVKSSRSSRGEVVFGNPGRYFTAIAQDNDMQWFLSQKGLSLGGLNDEDIPSIPDVVFSPPATPSANQAGNPQTNAQDGVIVGTPQQTQHGVGFRALIDSRVQVQKPFKLVKIDNSLIRRQKLFIDPGQQGPAKLTVLDQDGTYVVGAVRFLGDTRGQEWYMDVDGWTTSLAKIQMLEFLANTNNG